MREDITNLGYITVKEESLIYNPQTSFPNNEPTDVGLGIKPKSTISTSPDSSFLEGPSRIRRYALSVVVYMIMQYQ